VYSVEVARFTHGKRNPVPVPRLTFNDVKIAKHFICVVKNGILQTVINAVYSRVINSNGLQKVG
jgi:hypothetical protein